MESGTLDSFALATKNVVRLGFWAALATSVLALVSFGFAVLDIPVVGPNCIADCVEYPYADMIDRVPRDFLWMYPSMLMLMAALVLYVALQASIPLERRIYSQVALCFMLASVTLILADYYIQIATIQPSILRGESEGVALITQHNPHGVFIALEDLGYFLMALASLFTAFAFAGGKGLERAIFWVTLVAGIAVVVSYPVMLAIYGTKLEYRFEVVSLSIDWLVLLLIRQRVAQRLVPPQAARRLSITGCTTCFAASDNSV